MGKSLQDQLKQAGLANAKQAAKAKRAQNHKQREAQRGVIIEDEATKLAREAHAAKVERDRALNRERQEAAEARALQAQIVQLVDMNRIEERGDAEFGFTADGRIRTLHVTADDRAALVAGRLAIVRLGGDADARFEIVPRPVAKKVAERDEQRVVLMNSKAVGETAEDDDPYAEFQVPDDLMW